MFSAAAIAAAKARQAAGGASGGGNSSAGLAALVPPAAGGKPPTAVPPHLRGVSAGIAAAGRVPVKVGIAGGAPPDLRNFFNPRRLLPPPSAGEEGTGPVIVAPAAVARNAEISREVEAAYAAVLGPAYLGDIIDKSLGSSRANTNTRTYFTKRHATLIPLDFRIAADGSATIGGKIATQLAKGTYGSAWRVDGEGVYKVVRLVRQGAAGTPIQDWQYREVFIEALVQTILQNDERYGSNIAKIEKIYRLSWGAYVGFIIKMEEVRYTFRSYIKARGAPASLATVAPIFQQLGDILTHFKAKYGFHHRDLHPGNIMFAADGSIKLIDFGMSCLEIGGHIYSLNANPTCTSYDIFIFLANLQDVYYRDLIGADVLQRIRDYFTDTAGNDYYSIIYDWVLNFYERDPTGELLVDAEGDKQLKNVAVQPPQDHTQYYFYHKFSIEADNKEPWTLTGLTKNGKTLLQSFIDAKMEQRAEPAYFARAWGAALPALAGGARRRRKTRGRRRSRHTRRTR
jgi:serine/threonine protein kinase